MEKDIPRTLDDMSKDERSLLLYLETCAVDHGGLVDSRRMNGDDFKKAREWSEYHFIDFGRVLYADIESRGTNHFTHWVDMSLHAFVLAHRERVARAERMWRKRTWRKTSEKNSVVM